MPEVAAKPNRLPRIALPVLLVVSLACLAAAILLPAPSWRKRATGGAEPAAHEVPDFTLTERSGQPVSKADLLGKVWVASFVFTRCTGPCPSVTATVARLQSELDLTNRPDLRLVTFTVDPDRDTPGELKKYADTFRADPDRWLFLTGPEADVHRLAKDGFFLGVSRSGNPAPPQGQEFDHSTYLVVVDKRGRICGHFDGYRGPGDADGQRFADSFTRLKQAVAAALAE